MSAPAPPRVARRLVLPTVALGPALGLLALFVVVAIGQGLAMGVAAHGRPPADVPAVLVGFVSGGIGAWMALPVVQFAVANARDATMGWGRPLAIHLAGYAAFTTVHTAVMFLLRTLAGVVWRPVADRFGPLARQIAYEVPSDVILYAALAGLWYALRSWDDRRAAALRTAQLERALAQTRLDALTARLDPHFLFNTLHTVGALMHEDLAETDRLLARLGELLRASLSEERTTWTLAEEQRLTEGFVEILCARMGDRLRVAWSPTPSDLGAVLVPRFAIQSLVDNAVKHNEAREAPLAVRIEVALEGDALVVRVADDGVGLDASAPLPAGHGLSRLDEVLRLAFGPGASLVPGRSSLGGAEIVLTMPRSPAPR